MVNVLTWHGLTWRAWDACGTRGAWRVGHVGRVGAWRACARGSVARGARESAWERVGTRGNAWSAWPDLWRRVAARGGVSGEPETSGGAWGCVRGQIRPILVSMDRS